jgi:DNA-binding NarL/FixJ family response regulator
MDIFFVDASPQSRRRLTQLVDRIDGARVVGHAESAKAAIAAILEKMPDVVLLDLKLEEGSGFDVLREVRRREPGIDFYMLSNYSSEPYRRSARRLGAAGFFDKTTELGELCELLAERALTRQPAAQL